MKKDFYTYPAIFYYEGNSIAVEFPDLEECYTCADTTEDAIKMAKDVLGLCIFGREEDGINIPKPSQLNNVKIDGNNGILYLVDVFMPPIRDNIKTKFVKKTLSIPQWLNIEAERNGVNFSQVLQKALKDYLHLD